MAEVKLTEDTRKSRRGKIETAGVPIPAGTKDTVEVILDLDPVEYLDPARSLWFHLHELVEGQWRHVCGARWQGGPSSDPELGINPNPRFWFDAERVAGKKVRIEIEDPKGQQVGYKLILKS
jgi:hypothetical protein